jgi:hypothetical protein
MTSQLFWTSAINRISAILLAYFPYFEKEKYEEAYEIALLSVCLYISIIVARQRLGEHVPAATNTNSTIEEQSTRCFLRGPCRINYSISFPELLILFKIH